MTTNDPRNHHSVLVVDDDPEMTDMLSSVLADAGYRVCAANSGPGALTTIDAERPDLLITDLSMPEMGGLDLVRQARTRHPGMHFIILTAFGDWPSFCQAQDLKVDGYLTKPVALDELLGEVEAALHAPATP